MAKFPQVGDDFGPYRITDQIGHGGMGVVYAAEQAGLGRTVALKVLSPQYAAQDDYHERFVREASTLARLDSVHVIHIYDHGEQDGCLYIAMQNVRGGDLGQAIKAQGGLPVRDGATVVAQTAGALHDAHAAGVIHRDVKPSNVLLRDSSDDLHAYLCDFGIAQGDQPGLTVAGSVAGTMGYMAPERCRGEAASPASDIYALGCVLWTTLAGRSPFAGTDVEVGLAHLNEPVPQFRETDPLARMVNAVLRRSMAKDPAARYPDAAAMRRDLRAVADRARTRDDLRLVPDRGERGGVAGSPATGGSHPSSPSSPSSASSSGHSASSSPNRRTPPPYRGDAASAGSSAGLPVRPGAPRPGGARKAPPPYAPPGGGHSRGSSPSNPAYPHPGGGPSRGSSASNPATPLPRPAPRPGASSPSNPSHPSRPVGPPPLVGAGQRPDRPASSGGPSGQAIAALAVAAAAVLVLLIVVLLTV
ncbi:serine/threonine-protein kinase [Nocardioides zeae]|uniref:non-specific serine/threonine protein kinase n=1 Tax=Nocardioides zeae TaxID=1457234 RepID=A0AAJ1TWH0_9ACTN|nr:serine/threonine-protein kinase [Nocardioides zeae]MDQ1103576.1 serine/threonine protein kinase [Nocardioides zeae]